VLEIHSNLLLACHLFDILNPALTRSATGYNEVVYI